MAQIHCHLTDQWKATQSVIFFWACGRRQQIICSVWLRQAQNVLPSSYEATQQQRERERNDFSVFQMRHGVPIFLT